MRVSALNIGCGIALTLVVLLGGCTSANNHANNHDPCPGGVALIDSLTKCVPYTQEDSIETNVPYTPEYVIDDGP